MPFVLKLSSASAYCVLNPSRVYGVEVAVAASGTKVGVGGAAVNVAVTVMDGSGVLDGTEVGVGPVVGDAVGGTRVNCWEERVGKVNSVGVIVGV